ncbi:IclR family transcriptional regulator domain-containing protein [Bradyrhizobium arachidis]|uniref:IclR family transcriptional regulator n=1 Tax=Bradyrhizobium arachidis TaxID=858423 RepID=A0AAE7TFQ9_9BRAD|nr:IclR family transcriptional regulator C-terminal domain-containing protein [Bradyrhizobium arachidis]QOZ67417.1 IclR family transcriptional regulator [Bradyrhizobium arachidis]SFU81447.1 transcriptional regulator, IclR family [Bradyrhizobium arachidis]
MKTIKTAKRAGPAKQPSYFIQGLQRGLEVIRAFDRDHPSLTISEAARQTGLSRGTVQRFLLTLNDLGYASFDGKSFTLSPKVLDLGFAYLSSQNMWETLEPFVEEVVNELNESCTVGVLDWPDVIYVARVQARRVVNATLSVGSRIPAHASSLGHIVLGALDPAALDELLGKAKLAKRSPNTITDPARLKKAIALARQRGWALGDQEFEEGVRSVAVPLFDRNGKIVAAMKVVAPTSRASIEDLQRRFLPVLQRAAEKAHDVLRVRM